MKGIYLLGLLCALLTSCSVNVSNNPTSTQLYRLRRIKEIKTDSFAQSDSCFDQALVLSEENESVGKKAGKLCQKYSSRYRKLVEKMEQANRKNQASKFESYVLEIATLSLENMADMAEMKKKV